MDKSRRATTANSLRGVCVCMCAVDKMKGAQVEHKHKCRMTKSNQISVRAGPGPETCEGDECLISSAALTRLHVYIYQPALSCVTLSLSLSSCPAYSISHLYSILCCRAKNFSFSFLIRHTQLAIGAETIDGQVAFVPST